MAAVPIAAALTASPAARAQEAPPPAACPATDAALPPAFAAWRRKAPVTSAKDAAGLASARLAPGRAVRVALHGTREVSYPLQPGKPGGSVAHGGLLQLDVTQAGTYRVALSTGAWIDLVRGGQAVESTAHGRGPACSTIRKLVDFPLTPGAYVLQVSANAEPEISVLVTRAP